MQSRIMFYVAHIIERGHIWPWDEGFCLPAIDYIDLNVPEQEDRHV